MRRRNDWSQLVTEFENSGLTQGEFAKRRGITLSTFRQRYYAVRKRLRADTTQSPIHFLPVKVSDQPRGVGNQVVEVRLSQLLLRVEVGTDALYVVSLLSQLSRSC